MADVKVRFSRTINLGNYESMQISVESGRELKPNEKEKEAIQEQFEICEEEVMDILEEVQK